MKTVFALLTAMLVLGGASAFAQEEGPRFGAEFRSTFWFLSPRGSVRAGETGRGAGSIDLRSDLGIADTRFNNLMKATLKWGDVHRFVVEGGSYRFSGTGDVPASFQFSGTTYATQDTIFSKSSVQHVFGGYSRDLLSRELDRVGVEAGVAYLRGKADTESLRTGNLAHSSRSLVLPLVGVNYERNLTGVADRFEVSGDFSAMSVGEPGHFVKGMGKVGARLNNHVVVHGGYGFLNMKVNRAPDAFDVRLRGPVITVEFRDR